MKELKKIGLLSTAKVALVFGIILGLLSGGYYLYIAHNLVALYPQLTTTSVSDIASAFTSATAADLQQIQAMWAVANYPWLFFLMSVILVPIFLWIMGIISAWIYNRIAANVGGIKLDIA